MSDCVNWETENCRHIKKLEAENARLKEELEQAKSRQLGKFQVAVDVPELRPGGRCNCDQINWLACPFATLDTYFKPGPGCPRWEEE